MSETFESGPVLFACPCVFLLFLVSGSATKEPNSSPSTHPLGELLQFPSFLSLLRIFYLSSYVPFFLSSSLPFCIHLVLTATLLLPSIHLSSIFASSFCLSTYLIHVLIYPSVCLSVSVCPRSLSVSVSFNFSLCFQVCGRVRPSSADAPFRSDVRALHDV